MAYRCFNELYIRRSYDENKENRCGSCFFRLDCFNGCGDANGSKRGWNYIQLYTDNWADGYAGQHGATFPRRSGICFECQHFPDSPNRPYFPSVVLRPGQEYRQKTIYKFGIDK